jgi:hypothetical protein
MSMFNLFDGQQHTFSQLLHSFFLVQSIHKLSPFSMYNSIYTKGVCHGEGVRVFLQSICRIATLPKPLCVIDKMHNLK